MESSSHTTGPVPRVPRSAVLARCCAALLVALPCAAILGCKPNKRYDLIEAELRTRDHELTDTRVALEQARNLNRAYAQQQAIAAEPPPPPTAPVYVPVKEIVLGRGTGGVAPDRSACDEGLMVVVTPRDEDGSAVKVPARVDIVACDVNAAGLKIPIGNWSIPPDRLRSSWRSGLISTGYFITVPWQTRPSTEKVRLAVKLVTLDGRTFETDKDITVKVGPIVPIAPPDGTPTPIAPAPASPAPAPADPPMRTPLFPDPLPPGTEELPPPSEAPTRGAKLLPPQKQ